MTTTNLSKQRKILQITQIKSFQSAKSLIVILFTLLILSGAGLVHHQARIGPVATHILRHILSPNFKTQGYGRSRISI